MTIGELLAAAPATPFEPPAFPPHLLGAFRRRSITLCSGVTDETTVVYWFQSRRFTIDIRLPDGTATPAIDRQGWIGDTRWDAGTGQMSWDIRTSYQLHDQWPEPARLIAIGNAVIEVAPSGAYVEDWRQQATRGPLLGLRLAAAIDMRSGARLDMDGALIVAGDHAAIALSRPPEDEAAVRAAGALDRAAPAAVERYEVSIATHDATIVHSTCPARRGMPLWDGAIERADGGVMLHGSPRWPGYRLHFAIDCHVPDMAFGTSTSCTPAAREWLAREAGHVLRHATVAR
ncbi:hypothetical protein [Sphingomonas ginsenosidimutans]|uniref:hypothetical protein n=2 Tax=Sphingomonas TaxID=13687 RepID=UPI0008778663|nr:hypothetical protein [Sphingomonas ginsenosidimutans]MBY0302770.1 hypothetical protein [Sphingomonas ginsenosidimutans]